ncbi:MAG TPA: GGDEF domain-containing protein [Vicinamibacteria bacterium]|nr:GGDEF domain-containing protein [Vicinamibacteria bacterium]
MSMARVQLIDVLDAASALFAGWPRPGIVALGLAGVALTGFGDWATGVEWAFTLPYLLPITFVTWLAGRRAGLLLAAASSLTWFVQDELVHTVYLHPLSRYWDLGIQAGIFAFVSLLLASLREHLEAERALARHDALTGLANRRHFAEVAGREVARACRFGHPTALVFLDVDGFKAVNDTRGHATGDRLLRTVASALAEAVRELDLVARVGGDEFALLLPATDLAAARALVARVREALERATRAAGWPVGFSIGAVVSEAAGADLERMLREADRLMYEAKAEGGGGFRVEAVGAPRPDERPQR